MGVALAVDFSGSKRIHNMDDIGLQIDELTKRMCASQAMHVMLVLNHPRLADKTKSFDNVKN